MGGLFRDLKIMRHADIYVRGFPYNLLNREREKDEMKGNFYFIIFVFYDLKIKFFIDDFDDSLKIKCNYFIF